MSEYIAKASIEPRDYRVVFLIQEKSTGKFSCPVLCKSAFLILIQIIQRRLELIIRITFPVKFFDDIRFDAHAVDADAGRCVVFRRGEFHRRPVLHRNDGLDNAFAKGRCSDNLRHAIIL